MAATALYASSTVSTWGQMIPYTPMSSTCLAIQLVCPWFGGIRMMGVTAGAMPRCAIWRRSNMLCSRVACGQPFERVVHDIVGVRDLVDREIAFEHTAVGAELLDTIVHQGG